jgi:hypothetical protein
LQQPPTWLIERIWRIWCFESLLGASIIWEVTCSCFFIAFYFLRVEIPSQVFCLGWLSIVLLLIFVEYIVYLAKYFVYLTYMLISLSFL